MHGAGAHRRDHQTPGDGRRRKTGQHAAPHDLCARVGADEEAAGPLPDRLPAQRAVRMRLRHDRDARSAGRFDVHVQARPARRDLRRPFRGYAPSGRQAWHRSHPQHALLGCEEDSMRNQTNRGPPPRLPTQCRHGRGGRHTL